MGNCLASLGTSLRLYRVGVTVLSLSRLLSEFSEVVHMCVKQSWWVCLRSEFRKYLSTSLFCFLGSVGGSSDRLKSVSVNLAPLI